MRMNQRIIYKVNFLGVGLCSDPFLRHYMILPVDFFLSKVDLCLNPSLSDSYNIIGTVDQVCFVGVQLVIRFIFKSFPLSNSSKDSSSYLYSYETD